MSFSTKARPSLIIQTGDPVVGSNGTFAYNSTTNEFVVNYDGNWVPLEETEGSSLEPTTVFFADGSTQQLQHFPWDGGGSTGFFQANLDVTHITLGRGSSIEKAAFRNCTNLKGNLFIPKERIWKKSEANVVNYEEFYNTGIETVKIEEGCTYLPPRLFGYSTALTAANIPNSLANTDIQEAILRNNTAAALNVYIDIEADEWKDTNAVTAAITDTQNTFLTNTNTTLHISPLRDIAPYQIPWVDGSSNGNWADRNEYIPGTGSVVVWADYPNLPY